MGRTTREKLTLFAGCFTGLPYAYGTYEPATSKVWQVKSEVTADVMLAHLEGLRPYGVYLLTREVTRAVVADFDEEDRGPPLEFQNAALHYGLSVYIERSKSKGWHAWIFAPPQGVSAYKARAVVSMILSDIGCPQTEVFPKQDRLSGSSNYGNFINAPLFGRLVPEGRTVFVDPDVGFQPYPDQWDLLASVCRVTEGQLDELIELNELMVPGRAVQALAGGRFNGTVSRSFGLPPCAQRMLREGVTANQRVACFRLAVNLKKAGLPEDMAVVALSVWARKNRPTGDKQILTPEEIASQTRSAYSRHYRSCGCSVEIVAAFCSESCPLHAPRSLDQPASGPSEDVVSPASALPARSSPSGVSSNTVASVRESLPAPLAAITEPSPTNQEAP